MFKKNSIKYICAIMVLLPCFAQNNKHYDGDDVDDNFSHSVLAISQLCTKKIKAKQLCAHKIVAEQEWADELAAGKICTDYITTQTLCVQEKFTANDFEVCQSARATVVFSSNSIYTLGAPVNFDDILDDPNGSVSLSPVTTYKAPRSGYYVVSVQIDQTNLVPLPNQPILGNPITEIDVLVNGNLFRASYYPYLSFFNAQKANSTTLISLNAGDLVSTVYKVNVLNQNSGYQELTGTVDLIGDGTEKHSFFKIHYLSSSCPTAGPCENPCSVVPNGCEPCQNPCNCCPHVTS